MKQLHPVRRDGRPGCDTCQHPARQAATRLGGAGNNGPVSTAAASSLLNGPGVRCGMGWSSAGPERVIGVTGPLADLAALMPLGLPGVPGPLQLRGRGSGPPPGAEGPELQVRRSQPPAALRPRVGQHRGIVQVLDPPGQPSSSTSAAMRSMTARTRARSTATRAGPAVGGRAQAGRCRVAVGVQVREPVRALPQPAHFIR
jgi:hypothetical protein